VIGSGVLLGYEDKRVWRVPSERIIPLGMTNRFRPGWISTYESRQSSSFFERTFTRSPFDLPRMVFSLKHHVFHGEAPYLLIPCASLGFQVAREKTI
jgi:hypothetical protein